MKGSEATTLYQLAHAVKRSIDKLCVSLNALAKSTASDADISDATREKIEAQASVLIESVIALETGGDEAGVEIRASVPEDEDDSEPEDSPPPADPPKGADATPDPDTQGVGASA